MKKSYFQPTPTTGKPKKIVHNAFKVNGKTVHYKSFKEVPLWLKLLTGGVFAAAAFLLLVPLIGFENKEFDMQINEKTERIHAQIAEGKFREVFIEGDRELIAGYDEKEFGSKLAKAQKYLVGKYEKTGGKSAHYTDLANKLKRLVGKPALVVNTYSIKSAAGSAAESFYWIARGDELKLADYEFNVRNY